MKRLLIALLLALLAFACACAAENKTNPYFQDALPPLTDFATHAYSGLSIRVKQPDAYVFGKPLQWVATVTGGDRNYLYTHYIVDSTNNITNYYKAPSKSNVCTYDFIVPGNYYYYLRVTDGSGREEIFFHYFSLSEDSAHRPASHTAAQIVAQCRRAGVSVDYETALWLHDYLINHASYDLSLSYYSADAVLLRGTGVCNSYATAYQLLMEAAGIPSVYIAGGNHAWNEVFIDGQWCHIDATWDDPIDSEPQPAVSGWERHMYFGLTDEMMRYDHSFDDMFPCTSLDNHYYIRSGAILRIISQSSWSYQPMGQLTQQLFDEGHYHFLLPFDSHYLDPEGPNYYSSSHIPYIIYPMCAYVMERMTWISHGQQLPILVSANLTDQTLLVQIDFSGRLLYLPAGLKTIGEQAFSGDKCPLGIYIPVGVTTIESNAFQNCSTLRYVYIPSTVTKIADTAFSGCPYINIVCERGSVAQTFAQRMGIPCGIL